MRILTVLFPVLLLSSCSLARFVTKNQANITDHKIFPYTAIATPETPFFFSEGDPASLKELTFEKDGKQYSLDEYLKEETKTTGFLVIQNDRILFEQYYQGYDATAISNIFSVSKSVTSLLVGLALEDGQIASVDDPVTRYIPELNDADPGFKKLTIRHLLDMRSGLNFKEAYSNPFAHIARLYYGTNQLSQIKGLTFTSTPGTRHNYQSVSTAILGIVVEKATGKPLGKYLEEKVWLPLGMENPATWSVDDKKHRSPKAYCCLNTTARDLAKIGRLYLREGNWEGNQIISKAWIRTSVTPNMTNGCYQNQWYSAAGIISKDGKDLIFPDSLSAINAAHQQGLAYCYVDKITKEGSDWHIHFCGPDYYALGILGQYLYVIPQQDLIIVRLGEKWDDNYVHIFNKIAATLRKENRAQ
ncbi:MAG: serine hydrolase [Saprospiraceae bacterium]